MNTKSFKPPKMDTSYKALAKESIQNETEALSKLMAAQSLTVQEEPQVAQAQPQVAQAQPQVAQAQPQVVQAQPQVVQDEPEESTQESLVEPKVEKPRGATKPKNSGTTEAVTVENGEVVFNEPFQTNQIKRSDFGGLNYAAPRQVILEAKMRAMRDGLTILEVQNLLLAMYVESGLPSSLMKRYKKVEKKD